MNKLFVIFTLITLSVVTNNIEGYSQCSESSIIECSKQNDGAFVIQAFNLELEKENPEQRSYSAVISIVLTEGIHYRFNFCSDEMKTSAIRSRLLKGNDVLKHNFSQGQFNNSFDFKAKETGIYMLFIENIEGNSGCVGTIFSEVKDN